MNVSASEFEYMKEGLVKDMAMLLIEERGMSMADALDTIYLSDTYAKLSEPATGLYYQGARYVLSYIISEIETGKIA
ncbi:MAG: hypothetical protein IIU52_01485 [Bacteroidaceae bacterium]|jgi:hypothetical protein|nr:hypothetical protein [Bacteroidaceae bacterium]